MAYVSVRYGAIQMLVKFSAMRVMRLMVEMVNSNILNILLRMERI